MRVALVHEFLYTMRGAERVLDALCELYPDADLFSLIYRKGTLNPRIEGRRIRPSFLQWVPGARLNHRPFLPLYPLAVSELPLEGYDLVLSSSYAVAKGARVPPEALHVCYCHTPMRYVWDMVEEYFHLSRRGALTRWPLQLMVNRLRAWDVRTAAGVDAFIANSTTVRDRIRRLYGRESTVIHPPADAGFYTPDFGPREDWYLCASAFAPYKRMDLVMEAFRRNGRRLKVVGSGQDEANLRRLAGGNVEVLGWLPDDRLREMYRRCRALVFAGEEDFGIVPVEAQLCGAPVIAYGKGGLLDSVVDGVTGLFFAVQTVEAVNAAVERFEAGRIDPGECRRNAERFSRPRFLEAMRGFLQKCLADFHEGLIGRRRG